MAAFDPNEGAPLNPVPQVRNVDTVRIHSFQPPEELTRRS